MILTSIKRVVKSGAKSFWRNGSVSLASMLVLVVMLSVVLSLLLTAVLLQSTLGTIKSRVDVNVYFTKIAPEQSILSLKQSLEGVNGVDQVIYTSREQALDQFKLRHQGEELIMQALAELSDNPLRASLTIKATSPDQFENIVLYLDKVNADASKIGSDSIIEKVNYPNNKEAINALTRIIESTKKLGIAIAIFFGLIAILITYNTIRLAIYTSREEVAVMRLVGASKTYIRGPFLITGLLGAVSSTIIAVLIFWPITKYAGPITENIGTGMNIYTYYLSHLLQITGILLVVSIVIASISSMMAIKRYLRL